MKNKQKGFVVPLLLAIIAVLVIGGGVYVYESKKTEAPTTTIDDGIQKSNLQSNTSNWKTYKYDKYGFEIKLPSDWQVSMIENENTAFFNLSSLENLKEIEKFRREIQSKGVTGTDAGPQNNLGISYYKDISKSVSVAESKKLSSGSLEEYIKFKSDFVDPQKITFAGETAFRGKLVGLYAPVTIFVKRNNHLYAIGVEGTNGMDTELSDKILSTFKFISSNANTTNPPVTNIQSPVLKVNGPQSLNLNQVGTWTVNAYSPNDKGEGSTLTYSVKWGDVAEEPKFGKEYPPFTHAYSQFGTYTLVFTAKDSTGAQTTTSSSVSVINTTSTGLNTYYTYSNHGFTIQLPRGFIPKEEQSEGGPALMISLPTGGLAYVTNVSFWENYNIPNYTYVTDKKIGDTTFKVYTAQGSNLYWFKQGNVGYEFSVQKFGVTTDTTGLEDLLKTFKFIGWSQN